MLPPDYSGRFNVRVDLTPQTKRVILEEDGKPVAVLSPYDAAGVSALLTWAAQ